MRLIAAPCLVVGFDACGNGLGRGACAGISVKVGDGAVVHNNPVGVMTNAPTFDWHLINLRNYFNLSPNQAQPATLGKDKLQPLGEGAEMLSLPGDVTPEEIAQWETYSDLQALRLYFSRYDNMNMRMVDAAKPDFSPDPIRVMRIDQLQEFKDITSGSQ